MQILIDIPEGTKRAIDMGTINQVLTSKVWTAIKNGTPLPEHHKKIKEDLRAYELDCKFASDDSSCGICLDNIFGSFERMLDRHLTATKEGAE